MSLPSGVQKEESISTEVLPAPDISKSIACTDNNNPRQGQECYSRLAATRLSRILAIIFFGQFMLYGD